MKRVLAGPRFILEALDRDDPTPLEAVYILGGEAGKRHARIATLARTYAIRVEEVSRRRLDELAGGLRHQGVVAIAPDFPYLTLEELMNELGAQPLLIALDEITDPHNLGAIIRSAVAFGADGIILPERRSAGITGVVSRSSAGAVEHARIARVVNLAQTIDTLKARGIFAIGLAGEADGSIEAYEPSPQGDLLIVGSEGRGLRDLTRRRCDALVRIEMSGKIDSLNASVAAGIALHTLYEKRRKIDH